MKRSNQIHEDTFPEKEQKLTPEEKEKIQHAAHLRIMDLQKQLFSQIGPIHDNCDVSDGGYKMMLSYLFRWTSSIYRLIWLDMLIWSVLWAIFNIIYRLALDEYGKTRFEDMVRTLNVWGGHLPTTFLLGFFVSNVVSRWWSIYTLIPKMGGTSQTIRACIGNGNNPEKAEKLRINITRYLNLSWVLCLWQFCGSLKKRFRILRLIFQNLKQLDTRDAHIPSEIHSLFSFRASRSAQVYPVLDKITDNEITGTEIMSEQEKETSVRVLLEDLVLMNQDPIVKQFYGEIITSSEIAVFERRARESKTSYYNVEWWLPMHWAIALSEQASAEGFIPDTNVALALGGAFGAWSGHLTMLGNYAMRNLPLVYTQVVIIVVYSVFLIGTISNQNLDQERALSRKIDGYWVDYYIPILGFLQMVFMIGWFKVAMVLMDPFGNDDEDFPFSSIYNGNIKVGVIAGGNKPDLYPKKLQQILLPQETKNDFLASDLDDVDTEVNIEPAVVDRINYEREKRKKKKRHAQRVQAETDFQADNGSPHYIHDI